MTCKEIQTCEMTHEMAFEAIHIQSPEAYMIFLSVEQRSNALY